MGSAELGRWHCALPLGRSTVVPARQDNTATFGKLTYEDDGFYTSTKYWDRYFCKGEKVRKEFALINQP